MKKAFIYICLLIFVVACNKSMDEINTNPDKPTVVPPKYLATQTILNIMGNSTGKNFLNDHWVMKSIASSELAQGEMYNTFGSSSVDYTILINSKKMVELAEADKATSEEVRDSYRALNNFAKAWIFYDRSIGLGDVPCSEALKGEDEGIRKPLYDTQEEVFNTILTLLDNAASQFASGKAFGGDPVYNGDPKRWEKATNSFMLRVLIQLSGKTTVGNINVRQKFEEVAKRPLFASYSEDLQMVYSNKARQYYPYHRLYHSYNEYMWMQQYFVDMLTRYADNRLFYLAEPAAQKIKAGMTADDMSAYSGVDGTQQFADVQKAANTGNYSGLNLRYFLDPACEPVKKLAYTEIQFILAEAALKGWSTPMTAREHYETAVRAAIKFTIQYTQTEYRHGVTIDDAYINDYLANGPANFDNAANKLELILEQKYIASFMQIKWNSYYDYRRTGYPQIPINAATSMNVDYPDRMPVRWSYSSSEYNTNYENLEVAIKRQFGGTSETQNDVIWILK